MLSLILSIKNYTENIFSDTGMVTYLLPLFIYYLLMTTTVIYFSLSHDDTVDTVCFLL